jgi:hypothetical protein
LGDEEMSLIKIATNALVKRMANGTISQNGLNIIRKAGIMRGAEQVVTGQTKGLIATLGKGKKIKDAIKNRTNILTSHI